MFEKEEKKEKPKKKAKKLVAKKDFIISCNEHYIEIKEGDEVNVPERFIENLKTENVI